jgi:hypothetical protein
MNSYSAVHYINTREIETQRAATSLERLQAANATKKCAGCGTARSLDQFVRDSRSADGLKRLCKPCDEKVSREYRERSEVKSRETIRLRDHNLEFNYGVSSAIYDAISASQDHKCANAACSATRADMETSKGFHLDHDHKTGVVRGVLCRGCNVTLGNAGDSASVLQGLIQYLADHMAQQHLVPPPGASLEAWTTYLAKRKSPV